MSAGRDPSIEAFRGAAIALVVVAHVASEPTLRGASPAIEHVSFLLQHLRLPLLTVVSGYLFGLRPLGVEGYADLIRRKVRRLVVPLLTVGGLEFGLKALLPGVHRPTDAAEIWTVAVLPYQHFWFLQSLFSLFVVVGALRAFGALASRRSWTIAMAGACGLSVLAAVTAWDAAWFSLGATVAYAPFFILGCGLAEGLPRPLPRWVGPVSLLIVVGALAVQEWAWLTGHRAPVDKGTPFGLLAGLAFGVLAFHYRRPWAPAAFVGSHAYGVYLFQGFGLAIGNRVAELLGATPGVRFAVMAGVAVAFGIAMDRAIGNLPVLRELLLGRLPPRGRSTPELSAAPTPS